MCNLQKDIYENEVRKWLQAWWRESAGQSLVEVLVAVSIFLTVIGSVSLVVFGGQSVSVDSENAGQATEYAKEGIEAIKSIRSQNWNSLTDGVYGAVYSGGAWSLQGVSNSNDIFLRELKIGTVDANTKIATSTVKWSTDPGRIQKIELVEKLHNWTNPAQGSCKIGPLTGNWGLPQVLGSGDLGPGVSGTDVVVKLPYVFMSGTAATANKPDVFAFDVSNPISPMLLDSNDIGANGINSLFVKGNYLYAASPNDSKELIIFNISNPSDILEVASYNLSGSADGLSVYVFGNTAAVGREDSASYELAFFNVSNPASPTLITQIATGGDVNDFAATSDKLYVVSEESDEDIWVYNISDPLNPALITTYDITGETEDLSIFIQEQNNAPVNLLVGNEEDELITIGATSTGNFYVRDRINLLGDVNDIVCVAGDLAFLSTGNSNKEFIIVNVKNLDDITEYASINFPQNGTGIDFADNKVFMSVKSNDALRIITSSP